jgi:hypothetical protein
MEQNAGGRFVVGRYRLKHHTVIQNGVLRGSEDRNEIRRGRNKGTTKRNVQEEK